MKTGSYILTWLFFSASYVVLYGIVFTFFPEVWLWDKVRVFYHGFVEEGTWNNIYMSVVLLLALILNIVFIFLALVVFRRVRRKMIR